ncbi:MAG: aminoacyl-tRNA hydrolase, partial [Pseudomonadota bacterium]
GDFAKADQAWLEPLLKGIAEGAAHLAAGEDARFMNAVSQHTAPPRSSEKAKADAPKPNAPPEPAPAEEPQSKLQQLLKKFSK